MGRGRGNHWSWLGLISYRDASAKEQWLDHVSGTVTSVNELRLWHGRLYAVHPCASVVSPWSVNDMLDIWSAGLSGGGGTTSSKGATDAERGREKNE